MMFKDKQFKWFLNERKVERSPNNFFYLERRHYFVAFSALRALYEHKKACKAGPYMNYGLLYQCVRRDCQALIDIKRKEFDDDLDKIKQSKYTWIIRKQWKQDKYKYQIISMEMFRFVIYSTNGFLFSLQSKCMDQPDKGTRNHTTRVKITELGERIYIELEKRILSNNMQGIQDYLFSDFNPRETYDPREKRITTIEAEDEFTDDEISSETD